MIKSGNVLYTANIILNVVYDKTRQLFMTKWYVAKQTEKHYLFAVTENIEKCFIF